LELASQPGSPGAAADPIEPSTSRELERRLLDSVGAARHDEAREVLRLARQSWQLRDDDNLLLARVESQLLRALQLAGKRLKAAQRLNADADVGADAMAAICAALREPAGGPLILPASKPSGPRLSRRGSGETPRQLVGQPASQGVATGSARILRGSQDLGSFQAGEILVCDAIQPMMTHLVPLASAVVERRGGMLIHGAIIARELGIPCVNGIGNVVELLQDGDRLHVDGYLGIITVGAAEFDLELAGEGRSVRHPSP
jgi:pyruvate,water dikinase